MGANVGYIRVSSLDQNSERQLAEQVLDKVFEDKASAKDTKRPQLVACLDYLREGDTLHVHSIDRLARNLEDLQRLVRELTGQGISIHFHKEGLTFQAGGITPMQELMFHMVGAFAQFERSLIRERQREGIALAKSAGKRLGRKKVLSPEQETAILDRVKKGEHKRALAKEFGISHQTLYRLIKQAN